MEFPIKLEVLVQERYQGSMDKLVGAAEQMYGHLRELQNKKLDGPRWQYHNLRSEWPIERCDELEELANALYPPFDDPFILQSVQRSMVYKKKDKLFAIPLWMPVGSASLSALIGGISLAITGGYESIAEAVFTGLVVVGTPVFLSRYELSRSDNPFEKMGKELVNKVERLMNEAKVDDLDQEIQKMRKMV